MVVIYIITKSSGCVLDYVCRLERQGQMYLIMYYFELHLFGPRKGFSSA